MIGTSLKKNATHIGENVAQIFMDASIIPEYNQKESKPLNEMSIKNAVTNITNKMSQRIKSNLEYCAHGSFKVHYNTYKSHIL